MSDEQTPIADILNPTPTEAEPPQAERVEAAPETNDTGQPRGPDGKFAAKQAAKADDDPVSTGEKQNAAPPPVAEKQQPNREVPLQALIDQRLEAQQAKRERDELRRQLAELQQPRAEPVDFFADPDAAINQRLQPFQQQFQQITSSLLLRASKAEAVAVHGREAVTEMETAIGEAMQAGDPEMPILRARMSQTDDPVGVAMEWHNQRKISREVGNDPKAYREKLKAEILAELQASGAVPQKPAMPAVMPSNLAGARNVGTRAGPAWAGPTPLADIFKR